MKQLCILAALTLVLLAACKNEKKDAQEQAKQIFQIETVDQKTGVQRMQVSRIQQEITCKGKKFKLSIERTPTEDLPQVKSEMGVFLDNQIKVKITRDNGTALFEKTFTKKDFAAHLTEKYLKASVLEGLVFDDVRTPKKNEITLAASVSYPMTDLYVPFTLVITQDGKLSISKDEDMAEMVSPE